MTEKQTVMILDDTQKNARILSNLLQDEYELIFTHSAQDAVNILNFFKVDLILVNLKVSLPDSQEYFKKLKSEAEICHVPIYSITSLLQATPPILELKIMNHMTYF
ncbi:MAG: hypothetical protein HQL71_03185 [Magnetococcales bacterium]|nr:hypothetical protein [Magnetococcales bacterium]